MPVHKLHRNINALKQDPAFHNGEVRGLGASLSQFGDGIIAVFRSTVSEVDQLTRSIRSNTAAKSEAKKAKAAEKKKNNQAVTKKNKEIEKKAPKKKEQKESVTPNEVASKKSKKAKKKAEKPISVSRPRDITAQQIEEASLPVSIDTTYWNSQISNVKKLFTVFIILFIAQLGISTAILLRPAATVQISESIEEATDTLVGISGEGAPGVRILQDFTVNQGIVDVGFNVDVDKRAISTSSHTNCKTPVPPPDENGCGFTLIPSALGLPLRGVHYQRLYFDVENVDSARLKVDIEDFERGNITDDLGTWNSEDPKPFIQLPKRLDPTDGIQVRFWTENGDIVINQIRIEYLTVDHLKEVTLKVGEQFTSQIGEDSIGILYEDRNQDRLITPNSDEPWTCKADFPGIEPVRLDQQGSVILLRDDECYVETKPDFWYTDDRFGALPPGNWILVFPTENIALPFEIARDADKVTLELVEQGII